MGVDHGGGSGDKSPLPEFGAGGLSPPDFIMLQNLSTILLALQCRKMCFCLYSRTFIVSPAIPVRSTPMLRGYLRSIATWGQPTSQGTRNLPEYQISTQSGNAQLSYCSDSRFPWTGHFGNRCAFINVFCQHFICVRRKRYFRGFRKSSAIAIRFIIQTLRFPIITTSI